MVIGALVARNIRRRRALSNYTAPRQRQYPAHCSAKAIGDLRVSCASNPGQRQAVTPPSSSHDPLQLLSREEVVRGYIAAGWAVSCSECSPPPSLPFLQPLTLPRASACRMHDARARSSRLTNRMGRGLCRLGARGDSCGRLAKPSERRAGGPRRLTRLKAGVGRIDRNPPLPQRER